MIGVCKFFSFLETIKRTTNYARVTADKRHISVSSNTSSLYLLELENLCFHLPFIKAPAFSGKHSQNIMQREHHNSDSSFSMFNSQLHWLHFLIYLFSIYYLISLHQTTLQYFSVAGVFWYIFHISTSERDEHNGWGGDRKAFMQN